MKSNLFTHPLHLGLGAKAVPQPAMTGMEWYDDYVTRTTDDGDEGRLVSLYSFSESWTSWECHPAGDEVVICTSGTITLIQEGEDGTYTRIPLSPGECAINAPGVWHTADVDGACTALFITCGRGTQHRAR